LLKRADGYPAVTLFFMKRGVMVTHGINTEEYIFHGISDTGTYAIPVPYTMIHQHKVGSLVFPSVPSSPAQGGLSSVP
jgi:hypothetical protein